MATASPALDGMPSFTAVVWRALLLEVMRLHDIHFPEYQTLPKYLLTQGQSALVKTFGGLPVIILKKLKINTFSKSAAPFSLNFESKSGTTYKIEASHDLKQWGKIGEVQGTGSSVEFTDWREALFQKQYYRLKFVE